MPPTKRQRLIAYTTRFLVGCAILAVGIGIYALLVYTRELPKTVDPDAFVQQVAVMEARPVVVRRQWDGFGTARARYAANVPAQVRGVVQELPNHIVAGQAVERGDLIVQLDPSDFEEEVRRSEHRLEDIDAQVEQIEIELRRFVQRLELVQDQVALAQAELERARRAQERDSATQREVDQARQALIEAQQTEVNIGEQIDRLEPRRMQLQAARSQEEAVLRTARRNLERTTITSPIDGVIQQVNVDLGESIAVDQPVARVVNLSRIEVPLRFPASARRHVDLGDPVTLHDAGASGQTWTAEITRIGPEDDERTRTMIVYVEIEQHATARSALSPGKFVQGVVYSAEVDEQWIVPRRAVQGDRIQLIENGSVRSMRIERSFPVRGTFPEFGIPDEEWVALLHPLPDGAQLVLDGARRLPEGSRVRAVMPDEAVVQREDGEPLSRDPKGSASSDGVANSLTSSGDEDNNDADSDDKAEDHPENVSGGGE